MRAHQPGGSTFVSTDVKEPSFDFITEEVASSGSSTCNFENDVQRYEGVLDIPCEPSWKKFSESSRAVAGLAAGRISWRSGLAASENLMRDRASQHGRSLMRDRALQRGESHGDRASQHGENLMEIGPRSSGESHGDRASQRGESRWRSGLAARRISW